MARVNGTEEKDNLPGTDGDDVIQGFGGPDRITAKGGDDAISGDAGKDSIFPGSGEDLIEIEPGGGDDIVSDFGFGDDTLVFNRFDNIKSFDDLSGFIDVGPVFTAIDVSAANGGTAGSQTVWLTPAEDVTADDVAFDIQVIPPAKIIPFDPDPDPVLIADPSLKPPPLDKFAIIDRPVLPERPFPFDPPDPSPDPKPPVPPEEWWFG